MPAISVHERTRFLSVHQLAVAAYRHRCRIALFLAFLIRVIALTPHTMTRARLLIIMKDMAEVETIQQ
jgi:hypothetical protein